MGGKKEEEAGHKLIEYLKKKITKDGNIWVELYYVKTKKVENDDEEKKNNKEIYPDYATLKGLYKFYEAEGFNLVKHIASFYFFHIPPPWYRICKSFCNVLFHIRKNIAATSAYIQTIFFVKK